MTENCLISINRWLKVVPFSGLMVMSALLAGCQSRNTPSTAPKTIVFFGDSLTHGVEIPSAETYPSILQKQMEDQGWKIKVVNAGVNGDTSEDGLIRLGSTLDQAGTADVFVLALGANDVLQRRGLRSLEDNLNLILDRVKEKNPDAKIVVAGVDFGLVYGMLTPRGLDGVYERVAKRHEAVLMPNLLKSVIGDPDRNISDGIHPNAEGHRIIAENLWKKLQPLLQ